VGGGSRGVKGESREKPKGKAEKIIPSPKPQNPEKTLEGKEKKNAMAKGVIQREALKKDRENKVRSPGNKTKKKKKNSEKKKKRTRSLKKLNKQNGGLQRSKIGITETRGD